MLFTTVQFAIFFLFILVLNWTLQRGRRPYKFFLLIANFVFYGSLEIRFLPLLLIIGAANWFFALAMARTVRPAAAKSLLFADVIINLGFLAFFKYFEFFYGQAESLLLLFGMKTNLPFVEIIFPIGISFFTFQGLSYAIDVYRDRDQVVPSLVDVLLFVSFFPTVLSGPIMRARDFMPQLAVARYDSQNFQNGFALILSGLFKKIVIASYLSEHIVRQVFQVPGNYSSMTVLAAVYSYSIQIYCDFAGYSDLAMGLALLLGYQIPVNFRQPYRATNLQEFWHGWHISLSTWLRDYLYISLGGNRQGVLRKYINIMVTMALGGLWHGAHSRFILWGLLHGLGLVITHAYRDIRNRFRGEPAGGAAAAPHRERVVLTWLKSILCWFLTFNAVSFLWVFFRADNTDRAMEVFASVLRIDQTGAGFEFLVIPAILVGLLIQFVGGPVHRAYLGLQARLPVLVQAMVIALICVIILRLGPDGVLPFIYFQF
jgi:D-alanyl-lipoteichoic acid acyltransferase DltB (MBOAT superfamily)